MLQPSQFTPQVRFQRTVIEDEKGAFGECGNLPKSLTDRQGYQVSYTVPCKFCLEAEDKHLLGFCAVDSLLLVATSAQTHRESSWVGYPLARCCFGIC